MVSEQGKTKPVRVYETDADWLLQEAARQTIAAKRTVTTPDVVRQLVQAARI